MSDTKHEILGVPKESGIPFHYQSAKIMSSDTTGTLSEPRWHEELEIKLFLSGHAEIIVGADLFIAGPGDITVINPCQLHGTKPAGDEDAIYHLLMIPCDPAVPGLDRHLKNLMSGMVIIEGKKSTEFGIGSGTADLVKCILLDEKRIIPVSACLMGEYGETGVHCGVPCRIGENGLEEIIQLPLSEAEQTELHASYEIIRKYIRMAEEI